MRDPSSSSTILLSTMAFCSLFLLLLSSSADAQGFFDPHNHVSGILPWKSFANLSAWLENRREISVESAMGLWTFINQTFLPHIHPDTNIYFPVCLPAYGCVGSGMLATLGLLQNVSEFHSEPTVLFGALERMLTTTPFTEFESAYTVMAPVRDMNSPGSASYYMRSLYDGDVMKAESDYCQAVLAELAHGNITSSEQSIGYMWSLQHQCLLKCFIENPSRGHKMLQFSFGNRLAYYNATHFLSFQNSSKDSCTPTPFSFGPVDLAVEANNVVASFASCAPSSIPS